MNNTKLIFIVGLLIFTQISCESKTNNQVNDASGDKNSDSSIASISSDSVASEVIEAISEPSKSCSVEFTKPYTQVAIYSEFSQQNETLIGMADEFEKIFTYSADALSLLRTANFDNSINLCFMNDGKTVPVDSIDECTNSKKLTKGDDFIGYENVSTTFKEYIITAESNDINILKCEIKFIANQASLSNAAFNRSTRWIELILYIYDQKTSDGNYYFEYEFPKGKYSQNSQNQRYYQPVRGRDLRTVTTGTGVRE